MAGVGLKRRSTLLQVRRETPRAEAKKKKGCCVSIIAVASLENFVRLFMMLLQLSVYLALLYVGSITECIQLWFQSLPSS